MKNRGFFSRAVQDFTIGGFIGRMKRNNRCFRWGWAAWAVLLMLVSACSKLDVARPQGGVISYDGLGWDYYYDLGPNAMGIGTMQTYGWLRYIRLDASTVGLIVNQDKVEDIPDGTRVFVQYRKIPDLSTLPDYCTEGILVFWATPLDMGEVSHSALDRQGDPISIVSDWMTNLEDGYVTLHYSIPSKGKASHRFTLCPGEKENEFRLIHDANGDSEGDLTDGLVCFYVASLLPETGDETVTLTLTYLDLDNTIKTLTFDYRSPQ